MGKPRIAMLLRFAADGDKRGSFSSHRLHASIASVPYHILRYLKLLSAWPELSQGADARVSQGEGLSSPAVKERSAVDTGPRRCLMFLFIRRSAEPGRERD